MNISQLGTQQQGVQNLNVDDQAGAKNAQSTNISDKVGQENKKAAQLKNTEATQMEQMQDDVKKSKLKELVDEMNQNLDPLDTSLKFGFHDKSDTYYVSVIDANTEEVIRKFPTEEAMQLSAKMKELVGMIFDKKG